MNDTTVYTKSDSQYDVCDRNATIFI